MHRACYRSYIHYIQLEERSVVIRPAVNNRIHALCTQTHTVCPTHSTCIDYSGKRVVELPLENSWQCCFLEKKLLTTQCSPCFLCDNLYTAKLVSRVQGAIVVLVHVGGWLGGWLALNKGGNGHGTYKGSGRLRCMHG